MAKKEKVTATTAELTIGTGQLAKMEAIAVELDSVVMPTVSRLADARLEWQRGPIVTMLLITSKLTTEQLAGLPDPKSLNNGNNPAVVKVRKVDGNKEKFEEVYVYDYLAHSLPSVKAALKRADQIKRSLGNPEKVNQSDIDKELFDVPTHTRQAEQQKCENLISSAERNVANAFELFWQFKRLSGPDASKVKVDVLWALDENSKPCDGKEGRRLEVEATKDPIILQSTLPLRDTIDCKRIPIGTFLNMNVAAAAEKPEGITYQSLMNTLTKGTNQQNQQQQTVTAGKPVNTLQTFITTMNDVSAYLHQVQEQTSKADWDALAKYADADDKAGDTEHADFFYNLGYVFESLRSIVGTPRGQVKYQSLLNDRAEKVRKVA